ncbi:MAG: hypothetical protein IPJ07_17595, partial [Acidobacteria bacterium]|nr:hypothetical protein [Acidobacteriota bacterium]
MNWAEPDEPLTFSRTLFLDPNAQIPYNMRRWRSLQSLTEPGIVVVEAPMGEGKTETAMYLADHWNATLKQRGVYFALPTQATSNQM